MCLLADSTLNITFPSYSPPGASLTTHFEPMHKLRAHSSYILKCLISPDCQQLATTSSDKTVKLWNLDNNFSLDRTLSGHTR